MAKEMIEDEEESKSSWWWTVLGFIIGFIIVRKLLKKDE